jgi:hypothetical protein
MVGLRKNKCLMKRLNEIACSLCCWIPPHSPTPPLSNTDSDVFLFRWRSILDYETKWRELSNLTPRMAKFELKNMWLFSSTSSCHISTQTIKISLDTQRKYSHCRFAFRIRCNLCHKCQKCSDSSGHNDSLPDVSCVAIQGKLKCQRPKWGAKAKRNWESSKKYWRIKLVNFGRSEVLHWEADIL